MPNASDLVARLALAPHPEGGFYREVHRSPIVVQTPRGPRAASTSILFLLPAGAFSGWHRVRGADEVWSFHEGAPLALWTLGPDGPRSVVLSADDPQHVVPADTWQAAEATSGSTLCGCCVAPGFDFADFELAADPAFAGPHAEAVARLIRG